MALYVYLGHGVELYHGIGQRVAIGPQVRDQTEHGSVESSVDLAQRAGSRIINIYHRNVPQEPIEMFRIILLRMEFQQ